MRKKIKNVIVAWIYYVNILFFFVFSIFMASFEGLLGLVLCIYTVSIIVEYHYNFTKRGGFRND